MIVKLQVLIYCAECKRAMVAVKDDDYGDVIKCKTPGCSMRGVAFEIPVLKLKEAKKRKCVGEK
jgi:hypothetical protein